MEVVTEQFRSDIELAMTAFDQDNTTGETDFKFDGATLGHLAQLLSQQTSRLSLFLGNDSVPVEHVKDACTAVHQTTILLASQALLLSSHHGHALRQIIRSRVYACLKALSNVAIVATDPLKVAAKEHVQAAGQVLSACDAVEQCPKTMTAATAETLSTQLAQIEDAASEFAEAIEESQRLLSSDDVDAAIHKAMTQGIPIWDEDEEAMLAPLTALLKVAVKVVGKTRHYITTCTAELFQQYEVQVLELATGIAQGCDNVVVASYAPDEFEVLRRSSSTLQSQMEAMLDVVIALRTAREDSRETVDNLTAQVAQASLSEAAAPAADTATTVLAPSRDWPVFLKQVTAHNVGKLVTILQQLEDAAT